MTIITYRWRVVDTGPGPDPWNMKGKELGWAMTEESARGHEAATGQKLEKVPNSEEVRHDLGSTSGNVWKGDVGNKP